MLRLPSDKGLGLLLRAFGAYLDLGLRLAWGLGVGLFSVHG